jgi:hypothetical protein
MSERNIHSQTVKAWRASWGERPAPPALVDVYERVLEALWRRAHQSLGEITLVAIFDRVLHHGAERFPHLAALKVETGGVRFEELRQAVETLEAARLDESLAGLVVELLRVLGTLTGEVLTPGLHAELLKVRVPSVGQRGESQ